MPRDYLRVTSFGHMTRMAAEDRSAVVCGPRQSSAPPQTRSSGHERKALAGRCNQLLSGHATIGAYLCNKTHKLSSDRLPPSLCRLRGLGPPDPRHVGGREHLCNTHGRPG